MPTLRQIVAAIAVLMVLAACGLGEAQETVPGGPSIRLIKIGSEPVGVGAHVVVHESPLEVFGDALNCGSCRFFAIIQRRGDRRWTVGGSAPALSGGVFRISGVILPLAGDYSLAVAATDGRALPMSVGDEQEWRHAAKAVSAQVSVTLNESYPPSLDLGTLPAPALSILAVGEAAIRPGEKTPVQPGVNVIVSAQNLPLGAQLFLVRHIPYTDRAYIVGPGRRSEEAGKYFLPGITLDAPGDAQQLTFELTALASTRYVRPGPVSWESLRHWDVISSPPVEVQVDRKEFGSDGSRVPWIQITKIGKYGLDDEHSLRHSMRIGQGESIEVAQYARVYEGDQLWFLTRRRGSRIWMAQGPAVKRGGPPAKGRNDFPQVTWVWVDLRFEDKVADGADSEYEVVAVLSTALYPNASVDSTLLSTQSSDTISQIVPVSVDGIRPEPKSEFGISRIQHTDVSPDHALTVGMSGQVEVESDAVLPEGMGVYVVRHKVGTETWTLFDTVQRDRSYIVPDMSFINPHIEEGAEYQLMAIKTWGKLPLNELSYDQVLRHAVTASEVITVHFSSGWGPRFLAMTGIGGAGSGNSGTEGRVAKDGGEGKGNMIWIWLLALVAFVTAITYGLVRLGRGLVAAGRSPRRGWTTRNYFETGITRFLAGIAIFIVVIQVIRQCYLPLYSNVIRGVTNLPLRESRGLATWLVLITALLGIFMHLAYEYSEYYGPDSPPKARLYGRIAFGCLLVAVALWLFQGGLYFSMLSLNSFGLVPLLGGVAFTLIAIAETAAFFFVTKLTLPPFRRVEPVWHRSES
jgi:hypothetical protein